MMLNYFALANQVDNLTDHDKSTSSVKILMLSSLSAIELLTYFLAGTSGCGCLGPNYELFARYAHKGRSSFSYVRALLEFLLFGKILYNNDDHGFSS